MDNFVFIQKIVKYGFPGIIRKMLKYQIPVMATMLFG